MFAIALSDDYKTLSGSPFADFSMGSCSEENGMKSSRSGRGRHSEVDRSSFGVDKDTQQHASTVASSSEFASSRPSSGIATTWVKQIRQREMSGKARLDFDIFAQNQNSPVYQRDLRAHTGCVNAVDFSPTEDWIVSGGDDLKVRLWKTVDCCTKENPSLSSVNMQAIHHSNIFAVRFSNKAERVYSAGNDHRLLVHDIRTRARLMTYKAYSSIYCIATHPTDDNMIAAASEDRNVYLFDLRGNEGDGLCTKLRLEGGAYSTCWNPTNHNLVSVCNEKTGLLVFDLRMGNGSYVEAGKMTKRAICADWSPAGDVIFCVISRSSPICFNLKNSEHVKMVDPNYSNVCTIKSCTFAGENYMITGSDDWNIYVWKVPTNWETEREQKTFTVLKGHRSIVNHVKYGAQSGLLLSCGVEKIVKCWSGVPLHGSYREPKGRERLPTSFGMFANPESGSLDSDMEEDLDTLQRFDAYYEIQVQRLRQRSGALGGSDSSDESDVGVLLFTGTDDSDEEDGIDHESFLSELTAGLHSHSSSSAEEEEQNIGVNEDGRLEH